MELLAPRSVTVPVGSNPTSSTIVEERRVIESFPAYTISNLGVVRKGEKVLKGNFKNKYQYIQVSLREPGRRATPLIHKLVLEAFVGERPPGMEARHLDGNPRNNRLDNLAWGTAQENTDDKKIHGTIMRGDNHVHRVLCEQDVIDVRRRAKEGTATTKQLAKEFGISEGGMRAILNGQKWGHVPGAFKRKPGPPKGYGKVAESG